MNKLARTCRTIFVSAATITLTAAFALMSASRPYQAAAQQPLRPPTSEPGWIFVGNQTQVTFPDGSSISVGDQSRVPLDQRIVWVRRGIATSPVNLPPPPRHLDRSGAREGDVGIQTETGRSSSHQIRSYACNLSQNCAVIDDYSYVYYTVADDGARRVDQCFAATYRQWDNPYQVPQLSYNKVKSFVTTTGSGSYAPPSGTVQALTWTYVPGCFTFNLASPTIG